ncbi:MAG: Stk1 family PASTA domain-containing Ser/Thr kinase [Clostridia bacterium]|nr:Stk1 family PASTA domain-containing Ser/Thr kinase [Clostridia bacterium]
MDRFIGKRIDGRYEVNELIGSGGMASVYKAYDIIDERIVAIKILKEEFVANDEFKRRFKNESKAIAVLSHPNIVKVYDVSFGDVLQYIVMELCDGITLKEYIEQKGVIDWEEAAYFTTQILKALGHAHEKGIIHRDIKPQNIILMRDGTLKVADFGIARFSRSEQKTITDKAIGSVHYISPEQARGTNTDGKSDIYSVGVLLYEMTTGKLPFQADSAVSVAIMQLQNEPVKPTEINKSIPKGLEQIILAAMQKEPADRYPTAFDMLRDIEEIRRDPYLQFTHSFSGDSAVLPIVDEDEYNIKTTYREHSGYERSKSGEKTSKTTTILTVIAISFVSVLALLLLLFFNPIKSKEYKCPAFVGMTLAEIEANDDYNKFNIIIEESNNAQYEVGEVFKQTPQAGKNIKKKSKIVLYVSLGGEKIKIPDCEKLEYTEAKATLEEYGFVVKMVTRNDEDIAKDCVIKSYPEANEVASAGDEIILYVSLGPEQIDVMIPNVVGMYSESAKQKILDSGLKIGDVIEVNDSAAEGVVVSQYPRAYSNGVLDDVVTIYVSKGQEETSTTIAPVTEAPVTEAPTAKATESPKSE